jgi:hypothetical protein
MVTRLRDAGAAFVRVDALDPATIPALPGG